MAGKGHGQLACPGFLEAGGTPLTVLDVGRPRVGAFQARQRPQRGKRPSDRSQRHVRLSDVVEERCLDPLLPVARPHGHFEGVALVLVTLSEEQRSELGGTEPIVDPLLLGRTQRTRTEESEEPTSEVGCVLQAPFLQFTHRMDAGRNSRRASPMSLPHLSQVP